MPVLMRLERLDEAGVPEALLAVPFLEQACL